MKTFKRFIALTFIGTLSSLSLQFANADDTYGSSSLYRPHEFSVDLFGSGTIGQQTLNNFSGNRVSHDGRLGAGAGASYFITRFFGISGDAYTENTGGSFVDSASGNVVLRLPLGESGFAPYIMGGGGYQFDAVEQSFGQGGAGLEYRFTPHWGVFADARYVFADKTDDYGLGRLGLRLSF